MRALSVFISCVILLLASCGEVKVSDQAGSQCENCPSHGTCSEVRSTGDGCNTCLRQVWCEGGQWYADATSVCTLISCGGVSGEIAYLSDEGPTVGK